MMKGHEYYSGGALALALGSKDKTKTQGKEEMAKAKFSHKDTKGKLFVDCSECERGGNGNAKDKCSCGWRVKRGKKGGCFIGTLMANLEVVE